MGQLFWFASLICSICLEGLGRRYLTQIPSTAFYFLKDIILLFGFVRYRPPPDVSSLVRYLYRGFSVAWIVGLVWTLIELFNPEQQSFVLGVIGLRAYWLWWVAPPLLATALLNEKV